jgi:hypothetical protein
MSAGRVNKRCECNFTRRRSRGVSITELPENLLYGLLRLGHRLLRTLAAELSANGRRTSELFRDFSRLFGTFGAVLFPSRVRALSPPRSANTEIQREKWSERGDLNSRPPVPQTGALTELRYAPKP